jgi:hypothetical protein
LWNWTPHVPRQAGAGGARPEGLPYGAADEGRGLPDADALGWVIPSVGSTPCDYELCFSLPSGESDGEFSFTQYCVHTMPLLNAPLVPGNGAILTALEAFRVSLRVVLVVVVVLKYWWKFLVLFRDVLGA